MDALKIDTDTLFIGDGEIIKNGSVVLEGNKITYSGETEHAPSVKKELYVPFLMPGLWEAHCHFSGSLTASVESWLMVNPYVAAARSTWDLKELLSSGITSVREVGGIGVYLNRVVEEGLIDGPRIYGAGNVLGMTGGHSDVHGIPLEIYRTWGNSPLGELVDGVSGCLKGVRKQLRKGAEIIKVCASGGVMSELDHPIHQQLSDLELKTIVEEAHRADRLVAAHCHGSPGIKAALNAGVKTIEHGTYLDEDLAELMVEKKAILVPTRYVIEKLFASSQNSNVPEYAMEKLKNLYEQHKSAMKIAIKTGVKIAMGTDMFVSGPNGVFRHGENAMELKYLVEAGMKKEDALVSATGMGAKTVGSLAKKSGLLKVGYDADLLALRNSPLENIEYISNRDKISLVVKLGKIIVGESK